VQLLITGNVHLWRRLHTFFKCDVSVPPPPPRKSGIPWVYRKLIRCVSSIFPLIDRLYEYHNLITCPYDSIGPVLQRFTFCSAETPFRFKTNISLSYCLLGYVTVYFGRWILKFWKYISLSSSGHKLETVGRCSAEKNLLIYQTTRCGNPENHDHRRENLKPYICSSESILIIWLILIQFLSMNITQVLKI
jgi:hypothetical protein